MSRVVVYFEDQGRFVERDAFWYRLSAYRDGLYLGCWNGVVSGAEAVGVASSIGVNERQPTAVLATARRLEQAALVAKFREQWQEDVPQVVLAGVDLIEAPADRKHDFVTGEPVLAFVLESRQTAKPG